MGKFIQVETLSQLAAEARDTSFADAAARTVDSVMGEVRDA